MPDIFFELIGMLGPILFTWAYLQLSLGKWTGAMMRPHLYNFVGAVAVLISMIRFFNAPVFVLEIAWMGLSLYGMWRARAVR